MKCGILCEAGSDARAIAALARALVKQINVTEKGYHSGTELIKKGARDLKAGWDLRWDLAVVVHDADREDPSKRYRLIWEKVVLPAGRPDKACVVVPVQEIEAWILADLDAVAKVFKSWRPPKPFTSPELIDSPKEKLMRLVEVDGRRIYRPTQHNEKVAAELDLQRVWKKCPSYRPLECFLTGRKP